ncbi:carbohydrate-binding domain-containing protein [Ruminococcus sp. FC2018]|uniref:carbohydrate-binding domain-containing protein n=1 Tax=Ruminococcus sp. FC2018 TaxID=1410617 RepID=UPI0006867033|nr:carbohydrate-binding domain-containing protein [Ruminococcus sp. FC2018]
MLKKTYAIIISLALAIAMAGCSQSSSSTDANTATSSTTTSSVQTSKGTVTNANAGIGEATSSTEDSSSEQNSTKSDSDRFTERDLQQTADTSNAKQLTVSDNSTIDITSEGVYVISGTASNCTIKVNAGSEDKVQLVLDGVNIINDDFPAIYVLSADKCFVTTTEKENSLSVTGEFKSDGETNTDAVIFSKDDLVFNGKGTLKIVSKNDNGISGKDDIKFTGGTYEITSANDSVEANDTISICGGTFNITSGKDGLHCENDDNATQGIIYISGGTFNINASGDAIQGNTNVQVDGGTLNLKAGEGIESTYVLINGGTINIQATDDGINAANKSSAYSTPNIEINDGEVTISMGQGDTDAIDSNGNITVNGGKIDITAGTSSFDCDGKAAYNGGTIIINGTQVDSIPQSMMGGGGKGGMRSGRGGF